MNTDKQEEEMRVLSVFIGGYVFFNSNHATRFRT